MRKMMFAVTGVLTAGMIVVLAGCGGPPDTLGDDLGANPYIEVGQKVPVITLESVDDQGSHWDDIEIQVGQHDIWVDFGGGNYDLAATDAINGTVSYLKRIDNSTGMNGDYYEYVLYQANGQPVKGSTALGSQSEGKVSETVTTQSNTVFSGNGN